MAAYAEFSAGGETVRVEGLRLHDRVVSDEGIAGWRSTPQSKVESTERGQGHGAYPVEDASVLYSARTVTVNLHAAGEGRDGLVEAMGALHRMAGRTCRLRVVDGSDDTYADGYIDSIEWGEGVRGCSDSGSVTFVCPDPRRYSTAAQVEQLVPGSGASGGLVFDAGGCMEWPVSFGGEASAQNVCTLENRGTATAYPVIRVQGDFPDGLRVSDGAGGELFYAEPLSMQPLVLDCLTRTAAVRGVDFTRNLASRGFPEVPPGGSVTLALLSAGTGSVEVELRDTYI